MPEVDIAGVPVNFPFDPYEVQRAYMTKVIECLQNESNGVLESPTGTGKTLSLLCSTLAWILMKKSQFQETEQFKLSLLKPEEKGNDLGTDSSQIRLNWAVPKVIYATRTHSQLSQAVQELKQCSYSFMRAVVLGSRDQLCIHPEVSKEPNNANKIQLCKVHVMNKSCSFHARIESKKESPEFKNQNILDIEDLITVGRKLRMCPYYSSREVIPEADIVFMPYNYLLDPKARRANKVDLNNTIIILDEAHNVEKMCEESASVQIKSSDIALAVEDITHVMKTYTEDAGAFDMGDEPKDFTLDDLALLKEILLEFEKVIDDIDVTNKLTGVTYPGVYIMELLQKANIHSVNILAITNILDKLITFLATASQKNGIFRKGGGIQIFADFLTIIFSCNSEEKKEKTIKSFKVHIEVEEVKSKPSKQDGWHNTKTTTSSTKIGKIINYWCFNAGYGMEELLNKNVRSIILTSGTLAPLKPLIAELGIPVSVRLENPHIVGKSQVCVKIVSFGPDKEKLISNYENRDNPKYINSLGGTIANFSSVIPDGLLVFFPSYVIMNKCVNNWQASGVWAQINKKKTIFVEPQRKDAFVSTMADFYEKIRDPTSGGACFMAVCRGKVSEGLDFADMNGRAVIITGLPFPPYKDPRIILKRQYLDTNRTRENELLSGQDWYSLEASRAVNQAIGRVIRHKNDYGAIIFCDIRFSQRNQQTQLSAWIQGHLQNANYSHNNFGLTIRELKTFFENAKRTLPPPNLREKNKVESTGYIKEEVPNQSSYTQRRQPRKVIIQSEEPVTSPHWNIDDYSAASGNSSLAVPRVNAMDFMSRLDGNLSAIDFNGSDNILGNKLEDNQKRQRTSPSSPSITLHKNMKKKKLRLVPNDTIDLTQDQTVSTEASTSESSTELSRKEFLDLIKNTIARENYVLFIEGLVSYKNDATVDKFFATLIQIFGQAKTYNFLLKGIRRYVKENHKSRFDQLLSKFYESKEQ